MTRSLPPGGYRNCVTELIPHLQAVPRVAGRARSPPTPPDVFLADHGYDHDKYMPDDLPAVWPRCVLLVRRDGGSIRGGGGRASQGVCRTGALCAAADLEAL